MSRRCALVWLAAAIALGLLSRRHPIGWRPWDESLGDVLYSVAAYLAIRLLWQGRPVHVWMAATAFCALVEAFKLTGLPASWSHSTLSRIAFGTTPTLANLLRYFAGTTVAAVLESFISRRATRRRSLVTTTSPG